MALKILIACEFSGTVRDAFAARGFDAWSCDLLPTEKPGKHYQGDVRDIINDDWGLVIGHPPCTYLTVRAQHWNKVRDRHIEKSTAINFFLAFTRLLCPYAIENPVGIMSRLFRKPDQIIQPYQFGDPYMKKTCLWLHDLPVLSYTKQIQPEGPVYIGKNGRKLYWHDALPKSVDRAKVKSKTFPGIAAAMAEQWGNYLINKQQVMF